MMQKSNKNRNSMRSSSRKQLQKGYSLYHLNTMNIKLQNEQLQAKKFVQKMKQQKNNSEQINKMIGQEILKIQNDGIYFISRLEQEKRKYEALTKLVMYYEQQIYNGKKQKYEQMIKTKVINKSINNSTNTNNQTNLNQNTNTNKYLENEEQDNNLKELQKNYQQLILKNNTSEYQLTKKLDQVRTLRSERTILNKVFDQFQQEIFTHQFIYKQLVIQRYALDKYFENKIKQFQLLQIQAQKQYQKIIKNQHKKIQTQRLQFLQQLSTRRQYQNQTMLNFIRQSQQHTNNSNSNNNNNNKNEQMLNIQLRKTQQIQQYDDKINNNMNTTTRIHKKNRQAQKQSRFTIGQFPISQHNTIKQSTVSPLKKSNFKTAFTYKTNHSKTNSNTINNLNKTNNNLNNNINKQEQQSQRIQYQKKVKNIYNDLHINNIQQIQQLIQNLDNIIVKLYKKSQLLYQQIYKQNKYLQKRQITNQQKNQLLQNKQNSSTVNGGGKLNRQMEQQMKNKQNIRNNIQNVGRQYESVNKQIQQFWKFDMDNIWKCLNINQQTSKYRQQQNNNNDVGYSQEYIVQNMSEFQQKLCQLFPYAIKNRIKQSPIQNNNNINNNSHNSHNLQLNQQSISYRLQLNKRSKRDTKKSIHSSQKQQSPYNTNLQSFKVKKIQRLTNKQKILSQDQSDINKLQQILKDNRITHNNMTIYTEEQLIQIYNHIRIGSIASNQSNYSNNRKNNQFYNNPNTD